MALGDPARTPTQYISFKEAPKSISTPSMQTPTGVSSYKSLILRNPELKPIKQPTTQPITQPKIELEQIRQIEFTSPTTREIQTITDPGIYLTLLERNKELKPIDIGSVQIALTQLPQYKVSDEVKTKLLDFAAKQYDPTLNTNNLFIDINKITDPDILNRLTQYYGKMTDLSKVQLVPALEALKIANEVGKTISLDQLRPISNEFLATDAKGNPIAIEVKPTGIKEGYAVGYNIADLKKAGVYDKLKEMGYITQIDEARGKVDQLNQVNGKYLFTALREMEKTGQQIPKADMISLEKVTTKVENILPVVERRTIEFKQPETPTTPVTQTGETISLYDYVTRLVNEGQKVDARKTAEMFTGKDVVNRDARVNALENQISQLENTLKTIKQGGPIEEGSLMSSSAQNVLMTTYLNTKTGQVEYIQPSGEKRIETETMPGIEQMGPMAGTEAATPLAIETATAKAKYPGVSDASARLLKQYEEQGMNKENINKIYESLKVSEQEQKLLPETKTTVTTTEAKTPWRESAVVKAITDVMGEGAGNVVKKAADGLQAAYMPTENWLTTLGLAKKQVTTTELKTPVPIASKYGATTQAYAPGTIEYKIATSPYGKVAEEKIVLTDEGREVQQAIYDNMKKGEWKLGNLPVTIGGETYILDENTQMDLAYNQEFAGTPGDLTRMAQNIREIAEVNPTAIARAQNTWYKGSVNEILGEEAANAIWNRTEVKENLSKLNEGLTYMKAMEVGTEILSPWASDDDAINLALLVAGGGLIGEAPDIFKVVEKVSKLDNGKSIINNAILATGDLTKNTNNVRDFYKYAKDAKVEVPEATLTRSLLSTYRPTTVAMVTTGQSGSVIKTLGLGEILTPQKIEEAANLVKKFDSVSPENTAAMTNFAKELLKKDPETAKAALIELNAKDPIGTSFVLSQGSKGLGSTDRVKLTALTKEANESLAERAVRYANKIAEEAVENPIITGKLLAEDAAVMGRTPVDNLVNKAIESGSEKYDTLINAKNYIDTFEPVIEKQLAQVTTERIPTTGVIAREEERITSLIPGMIDAGITDWGRYTKQLENMGIQNIEDIAKLSDDDIKDLGKALAKELSPKPEVIQSAINAARKEAKGNVDTENKILGDALGKSTDWMKQTRTISMENAEDLANTIARRIAEDATTTERTLKEARNQALNKLSAPVSNEELIAMEKIETTRELEETPIEEAIKEISPEQLKGKTLAFSDTSVLKDIVKRRDEQVQKLADLQSEYVKKMTSGASDTELAKLSREINSQRETVKVMNDAVDLHEQLLGKEIAKETTSAKPYVALRNKTPSEAAKNALDELKVGNIETAARKLKESKDYAAKQLMSSAADMKKYDGVSIAKIKRMREFGAPENLVKQMVKERSEFALQELAKQGDEAKRLAFKISQGDELTEAELKTLWDKYRPLAKDAMETDVGNKLIEKMVTNAIAKGEDAIKDTKKAIKDDLVECIKKNECGTASLGLSAGTTLQMATGALVATGAIGAIVTGADGKQYYYDANNNTYNEIKANVTATGEPGTSQFIGIRSESRAADVISPFSKVLSTLFSSGLWDKEYSEGKIPGTQGPDEDKTEYMCGNYALDAAKTINNNKDLKDKGIKAKVVRVLGKYTSGPRAGDPIAHALIKVEDTTKPIGQYTDSEGNVKPIYLSQLIEPQTGQTSDPAFIADYSGTKMDLFGNEYEIDLIQELESVDYGPRSFAYSPINQGPAPGAGTSFITSEVEKQ